MGTLPEITEDNRPDLSVRGAICHDRGPNEIKYGKRRKPQQVLCGSINFYWFCLFHTLQGEPTELIVTALEISAIICIQRYAKTKNLREVFIGHPSV